MRGTWLVSREPVPHVPGNGIPVPVAGGCTRGDLLRLPAGAFTSDDQGPVSERLHRGPDGDHDGRAVDVDEDLLLIPQVLQEVADVRLFPLPEPRVYALAVLQQQILDLRFAHAVVIQHGHPRPRRRCGCGLSH